MVIVLRPMKMLRIVVLDLAPLLIAVAPHLRPPNLTAGSGTRRCRKIISAGAPGDPLAIANASMQASAKAAQTTMDLGRGFLGSLGLCPKTPACRAGRGFAGRRPSST